MTPIAYDGARILSIHGEMSDTEDGQDISTGPNATGTVTAVYTDPLMCEPGEGRSYSVGFDNGVSVIITDKELADPAQYQVLDEPQRLAIPEKHVNFVRLGTGTLPSETVRGEPLYYQSQLCEPLCPPCANRTEAAAGAERQPTSPWTWHIPPEGKALECKDCAGPIPTA